MGIDSDGNKATLELKGRTLPHAVAEYKKKVNAAFRITFDTIHVWIEKNGPTIREMRFLGEYPDTETWTRLENKALAQITKKRNNVVELKPTQKQELTIIQQTLEIDTPIETLFTLVTDNDTIKKTG